MLWRFLCSQPLLFYPATWLILTSAAEARRGKFQQKAPLVIAGRQHWKVRCCSKQRGDLHTAPAFCNKNYNLQQFSGAFSFPSHCDLVTLASIPSSAIHPILEPCQEQHGQPASQGLAGVKLAPSLPGLASLSGFSSRAKDEVSP